MTQHIKNKAVRICLWSFLAIAIALAILLLIIPFFYPWTPVNCWHDNIDVTCGRYRYERYLLWIKVADWTSETEISQMYRKIVGTPPTPEWRCVNTFSPGVHHSPHYRYHGMFGVSQEILDALKKANFTEDAQKASLLKYFELLQACGRKEAYEFMRAIQNLACEAGKNNASEIGLKELPAAFGPYAVSPKNPPF